MSKYNHYARDLDRAFKEARKIYSDAYRKVQLTKDAYEKSQRCTKPDTWPGENEWYIEQARMDYKSADADFYRVKATVWTDLETRKKELTAALQKELDADGLADPGAVNGSALELMRSGVLSVADYRSFAERYADNRTMRRLVAHYAQEAADKAQDSRERASLVQVAQDCADSTMQNWETLCAIMARCAGGRPGRQGDPDLVANMAARWEDFTQSTVEGF